MKLKLNALERLSRCKTIEEFNDLVKQMEREVLQFSKDKECELNLTIPKRLEDMLKDKVEECDEVHKKLFSHRNGYCKCPKVEEKCCYGCHSNFIGCANRDCSCHSKVEPLQDEGWEKEFDKKFVNRLVSTQSDVTTEVWKSKEMVGIYVEPKEIKDYIHFLIEQVRVEERESHCKCCRAPAGSYGAGGNTPLSGTGNGGIN